MNAIPRINAPNSLISSLARRGPTPFWLPDKLVRSALDLYREEYVLLERCEVTKDDVVGYFSVKSYPLTKPGLLPYVTSPLLLLMLSQLGYVFLASVSEQYIVAPAFPLTNLETFKSIRDSGRILISGLDNVRFRKKIDLPGYVEGSIRPYNKRQLDSGFFVRSFFSFGNNSISGDFDMFIAIPHD